jgi:glycosyltransferase involved in cell wall biosynthesis
MTFNGETLFPPPPPAGQPPDDLWIVLPHLGPGGAQKVALLAAEHFARSGHTVKLVTLLPEKAPVHVMPPGVGHLDLGPIVAWDRGLTIVKVEEALDRSDRSPLAIARRVALLWIGRFRRRVRAVKRRLSPLGVRLLLGFRPRLWPPQAGWRGRIQLVLLSLARKVGGPQGVRLQQLVHQRRPRRLLAMLSRTNMLTCLAAWDLPIRVVVSERNDPRLQHLPFPWNRLRPLLYGRADVVTANTSGVQEVLRRSPVPFRRLELLSNPLPQAGHHGDLPPLVDRSREFLAVCRLVPQKGVDLLLAAFARMPETIRRQWTVRLVGDGPERAALEHQARELEIAHRVIFEGFQTNPTPYYLRAPIFVLPSRFEGMPNALLEAMGFGLVPIVTNASPGPLELVEDGVTGLVVTAGQPESLAMAMARLASDPALQDRCSAAAIALLHEHDWSRLDMIWREILDLPALIDAPCGP